MVGGTALWWWRWCAAARLPAEDEVRVHHFGGGMPTFALTFSRPASADILTDGLGRVVKASHLAAPPPIARARAPPRIAAGHRQ